MEILFFTNYFISFCCLGYGKKAYKDKMEILPAKKRICYYSGELNSNGGTRKPLDCRPYCLYASTDFLTGRGFVDDNGLRSHGFPVRVVYAK